MRVALVLMVGACTFEPGVSASHGSVDATTTDSPTQLRDAAMPPPDGSTTASCPAGYAATTTGVYRVVSTSTSWLVAEHDCEDDLASTTLHTHLVVIDDAAENAVIATPAFPWLGATDLPNEGALVYATAQPATYTQSLTGNAAAKDCVRIRDDGAFLARDCNEANPYVCECDAFAASASRYPDPPNGN